jgi:hypothetical protein
MEEKSVKDRKHEQEKWFSVQDHFVHHLHHQIFQKSGQKFSSVSSCSLRLIRPAVGRARLSRDRGRDGETPPVSAPGADRAYPKLKHGRDLDALQKRKQKQKAVAATIIHGR